MDPIVSVTLWLADWPTSSVIPSCLEVLKPVDLYGQGIGGSGQQREGEIAFGIGLKDASDSLLRGA